MPGLGGKAALALLLPLKCGTMEPETTRPSGQAGPVLFADAGLSQLHRGSGVAARGWSVRAKGPARDGGGFGAALKRCKQSTQAINRLHNLLARVFPELATLTDDVATGWVLQMLDKYPTAERIAQARLQSLHKIPYLSSELAQRVQAAAQQSVACLRGTIAEALVRDLVAQLRHCQRGGARRPIC
jgi:hypothetical protein